MSKSKGNVIDPLDIIEQGYGADTLRTYELFIGPYDLDAAWDTKAIGGVYRFLNRCWTLAFVNQLSEDDNANLVVRHRTIKKVTTDLHRNSFNTAVATLMEYVNALYKTAPSHTDVITLARLLKPFAPHLASEILEHLSSDDAWPTWDERYLNADQVELIVQINGKLRARIQIAADADDDAIKEIALSDPKVQEHIEGHELIKSIVVPKNHLINLVIK